MEKPSTFSVLLVSPIKLVSDISTFTIISSYDCASVCVGDATLDICEVCNGGKSDITECTEYPENITMDCNGVCGGDSVIDDCGICTGIDGYVAGSCYDCSGTPNGTAVQQTCGCGTQGEFGIPTGFCDCDGNTLDCLNLCGGDALENDCGTCDNDATNDGTTDNCGVCDNDSTNDCVQDCAGVWGGILVDDECNVCGGTGKVYQSENVCGDIYQCVSEYECNTVTNTVSLLFCDE